MPEEMSDLRALVTSVEALTKAVQNQVMAMEQGLNLMRETQQGLEEAIQLTQAGQEAQRAVVADMDHSLDDLAIATLALQKETIRLQSLSDLNP